MPSRPAHQRSDGCRLLAAPGERLTGTGAPAPRIDDWLAALGLVPIERASRDGVESRDLRLDGRRRAGIRVTVIVAPGVGLLAVAHYAPQLNDSFRKTYERLLRWNDELPFVKFALSEDARIMLQAEVPEAGLDRDTLGRTLARLVAVCDLLHDESAGFIGQVALVTPAPSTPADELLRRYEDEIAELTP